MSVRKDFFQSQIRQCDHASAPAGKMDAAVGEQHSDGRSGGVNQTIERGGDAIRCKGLVVFIGRGIQCSNYYATKGESRAPRATGWQRTAGSWQRCRAAATTVEEECEYGVLCQVRELADESVKNV